MRKTLGFGTTGIVLILVIIALLGVIGWRVYDSARLKQDSQGNQSSATGVRGSTTPNGQTYPKVIPLLKLADGHVVFAIQDGWSASSVHTNTDCMRTIESTITCIDQSSVFPDAAGKVDGAPAYSVEAAVYKHNDNSTAKQWWENQYKGDNDTTSISGRILNQDTTPIAGYDAYSFTLDRGNNSGDINYILTSKDYVILVTAVAEGSTPSTGVPVQTFLPAIKSMVASVKIQ